VTVILASFGLFMLSAMAQRDQEYMRAESLLKAAGVVLVIGALVLGVAFGVMLWRDSRRTDEAMQDLARRADRLRGERRRRREQAQRSELPGVAPPTIRAPGTGPAKGAPGKVAVAGAGVAAPTAGRRMTASRAEKDLSTCPLCQTRVLRGEVFVSCPSCHAQYHDDCWEYNGGCAVYGCGGA